MSKIITAQRGTPVAAGSQNSHRSRPATGVAR
jgi:hypothetical protein